MSMSILKRTGSFILALALSAALLPVMAFAAPAQSGAQDTPLVAQEEGNPQPLGDELLWEVDSSGTLRIWPVDGKHGELNLSGYNTMPWASQAAEITHAEIAEGVAVAEYGNIGGMFRGCSSLVTVDLSKLDTTWATGMSGMFSACTSLLMVDLSNFETSEVSRLDGMFSGCSSLVAVDLSSFNTSGAFKMDGMFAGCSSLVRVKLGDKFRFTTEAAYLPEGEWKSAASGATYSPEQIATSQQGVADTYTNTSIEGPAIVEGENVTWAKGSKDGFKVRSSADIMFFESVKVDGASIDAKHYDVTEGSTVVALKPSYLQTLAEGEHAIDIVSLTGVASTKFTVAPDPAAKPDTPTPPPSKPDTPTPPPSQPDTPTPPSQPDNPGTPTEPEPSNQGYAMYRLYNPNSGEHFYTSSVDERNHLMWCGWKAEGTAWTAPAWGSPVYRLYNPNAGEHHYTTSEIERAILLYAGWNDEGVGWYTDSSQRVPVYRVYNPNAYANNHHYTPDAGERDVLVAMGWHDEGVGWHGIN